MLTDLNNIKERIYSYDLKTLQELQMTINGIKTIDTELLLKVNKIKDIIRDRVRELI